MAHKRYCPYTRFSSGSRQRTFPFHRLRFHLLLLAVFVCVTGRVYPKNPEEDSLRSLRKSAMNDEHKAILINDIFDFYSNDGTGSYNPYTSDGILEYPKGSYKTILYQDGIVWGLYHNGVKKVGGGTNAGGMQAGRIIVPGTAGSLPQAESPSAATSRIFRVRPDINPATLFNTALETLLNTEETAYLDRFIDDGTVSPAALYDAYLRDWNEWPAAQGAPFADRNGNGIYEPGTDIPGVPGADQTLWCVMNDLDSTRVKELYGSTPIGLELQTTVWAYRGPAGGLRSSLFLLHRIINKSGSRLDSMYIAKWTDCDLGGAQGYKDDFVGCDTILQMGYVYNGREIDGGYGKAVPAGGFVQLYGPINRTNNPSDAGWANLKPRRGIVNTPLSRFFPIWKSDTRNPDPRFNDPRGTVTWYNIMSGRGYDIPGLNIDPLTGQSTSFPYAGDPVTGAGYIDGIIKLPDDRRFATINGPFAMADGDTQEVCYAFVVGQAKDRLTSISKLRFHVKQVRSLAKQGFLRPASLPTPVVQGFGLDREILIDWSDPQSSAVLEGFKSAGYVFQGYNIYQGTDAAMSDRIRCATYDVVDAVRGIADYAFDDASGLELLTAQQYGDNTGICRTYRTKIDLLRNAQFLNYRTCYFGVSAYAYNASVDGNRVVESPIAVVGVIPQPPVPGTEAPARAGLVITADTTRVRKTGTNDGAFSAAVVNPNVLTGHIYCARITKTDTVTSWSIIDSTTGQVKASALTLFSTTNPANPIVDGIQFGISNPGAVPTALKAVLIVSDGTRSYSQSVLRALSPDGNWFIDAPGATYTAAALPILSSWERTGLHDYEVRFTPTGSEYYVGSSQTGNIRKAANRLPLELWDISQNVRLTPRVLDMNGNGVFDTASGISTITNPCYEPITMTRIPGYSEPLPAFSGTDSIINQPITGFVIGPYNSSLSLPTAGTIIRFVTNKPLLPGHQWVLRTDSLEFRTNDRSLLLAESDRINVFPNPYIGYNPLEDGPQSTFVTFTHLPRRAVIRIFTLSGTLMRLLQKDDAGSTMKWNLRNESGRQAAYGVYVAYIDLPDLKKTRVLKFAIIPME